MQPPLPLRSFLACLVLFGAASAAPSQPLPPLPPNPAAPVLRPVAPLGMQRGTSLTLTLTGANLAEPTGLWTSFPAKVTIPTDNNNGKDNAKLQIRLEVPADVPLGFYTVRLATTRGMSNPRLFCIDDLPQVQEVDTNRSPSTAQPVPVPCVVCAKADAEVNDYFKVSVKAGQRVSFEVLGRRLGSAFDPQLTLLDPRTGRELAGGHSNDAPGLQTDARLTHTFKDAGDYLVEVRDVSYRGGDDFYYRLRIGDFPCATTPLPLAARRGTKVNVQFAGPTVDGVAPVALAVPTDPALAEVSVTPRGANGLAGWPVSLALSDLEEVLEQEPNNELARANRVPVPGAITARFQDKGDVDYFVFAAKKGTRYILEAQSHELHSPAEIFLVLRDAKGNQVQATNPMAGPRLDFTAPADGDFYVSAEHLLSWGGPEQTYRLTVTPHAPSFDLALALDRFDVAQAGTVVLPIFLTRRDYAGPVEVGVVGPAGLTGQGTIAAGQPPQPNQPALMLPVKAAVTMSLGPVDFKIQGKATINGQVVTRTLSVRDAIVRDFAGLPVPPRSTYTQLGLAVTPKAPFALALRFDQPVTEPGKPVPLTVTTTRDPGFTAEIVLAATGLPPNVAPALKNIPANQNEVKAQLNTNPGTPVGQFPIVINGKAKHQNHDFSVNADPVPLVLEKPLFTLTAAFDQPMATPGKPAPLTVKVVRTAGFTGEITLSAAGLPANVTAALKNLAVNQNEVKLELQPAANAAVGMFPITLTGKAKHQNRDYTVTAAPVTLVLKK